MAPKKGKGNNKRCCQRTPPPPPPFQSLFLGVFDKLVCGVTTTPPLLANVTKRPRLSGAYRATDLQKKGMSCCVLWTRRAPLSPPAYWVVGYVSFCYSDTRGTGTHKLVWGPLFETNQSIKHNLCYCIRQ